MVRLSDREGCSLTIIAEPPVPLLRKIKHLKRPHSGMLFPDGSDSVGGGNAAEVVAELRDTRRQSRLIDNDEEAAMERKKREGCF
jgi:hypothetical protein